MSQLAQSSTAIAQTAEILAEVHDPECNLAVWKRKVSTDISSLLSDMLADVRFEAPLDGLGERLRNALQDAGFADHVERDELIADAVMLAERYCSVLDLDALELRFEIVTTNSCRKWHADYVKARLITTYVGTGTQWLDSEDAARVKHGDVPLRINTMAAGDVGIFKGKIATENPVIHRSPPIEGTGETRLLLVLNPPEGD